MVLGQWTATGGIVIGEVANSKSRVEITSGAISLKTQISGVSYERIGLSAAGVLTIKDSAGTAVMTLDASAGATFNRNVTIGNGAGFYMGNTSFASPGTGIKIWSPSATTAKIAGYNAGTEQWYADTDGKLKAGSVTLDSTGVSVTATGSYSTNDGYTFITSGTKFAGIHAKNDAYDSVISLSINEDVTSGGTTVLQNSKSSAINVRTIVGGGSTYEATIYMTASQRFNGKSANIVVKGAATSTVTIDADSIDLFGPVTLTDYVFLGTAYNPSAPSSGAGANLYIKSNKLVIQYNDAGTTRYKYLDLTGTGVTWIHSTTAP